MLRSVVGRSQISLVCSDILVSGSLELLKPRLNYTRVQVFPIGFVERLRSGFDRLCDLAPAHGRMNLKYEKGNWWMPWH